MRAGSGVGPHADVASPALSPIACGVTIAPGARFPLLAAPGYPRFWIADTVSMFGTHVTVLALQVLAVVTLEASATELGVLNAARWLPYLLFGLLAGVLADRYRRRPVLVGTDLIRAALLGLIPLLAWWSLLSIPVLAGFALVFGAMSLLYDAAHQSYLPRLVPPALLTQANARMEQAGAVAQTTGPLLAGGLVRMVGAPIAILVDAASYLVSGGLLAWLRITEPAPSAEPRHLRREIREGLSWVYGHPMLAPMALTTHAWFLGNSMVTTVYVPYALRELHLGCSASASRTPWPASAPCSGERSRVWRVAGSVWGPP